MQIDYNYEVWSATVGIRILPWLKSIASSPGSDTANLEDIPITIKETVQ